MSASVRSPAIGARFARKPADQSIKVPKQSNVTQRLLVMSISEFYQAAVYMVAPRIATAAQMARPAGQLTRHARARPARGSDSAMNPRVRPAGDNGECRYFADFAAEIRRCFRFGSVCANVRTCLY